MSYIYSQALVEAFLPDSFSDTGASVPSSLSLTPKPCLWHDKTTEASRLSQFGMTCELLTDDRGAKLLMSFAEAFRAKTLAIPGKKKELKEEAAADFGDKWRGSFAKYDRDTCSWKTSQRCLIEGWGSFSETWPRSGLMLNGACWELPMLVATNLESEFGYWPTLKASDGEQYSSNLDYFKKRKIIFPDLPVIVALNTPPTEQGHFGKINPAWCEWLMGWPIGWTRLEPLETDKTQEWQQQHSQCLPDVQIGAGNETNPHHPGRAIFSDSVGDFGASKMGNGMIRLETAERGDKRFGEIVLELGDLAFRRQITCQRDVMLAHRLARQMGVEIVDFRAQHDTDPYDTTDKQARLLETGE